MTTWVSSADELPEVSCWPYSEVVRIRVRSDDPCCFGGTEQLAYYDLEDECWCFDEYSGGPWLGPVMWQKP